MGNELEKTPKKVSLLAKMAAKNEVEPTVFLNTIKATVIKGPATNEQITAFLMVANRYDLDPWRKEIHAFADKGGGVVPIVGVDGWISMAQRHPQFDGEEVRWSERWVQPDGGKKCPDWCEYVVYRKDRAHPTVVREYLDECYRKTGPWQSHTKRMLRHKAMIQAYRVAFGFSGLYDEDEAERIAVEGPDLPRPAAARNAEKARMVLAGTPTPAEASEGADEQIEAVAATSEEVAAQEAEAEEVSFVTVDENGEVIEDAEVEEDELDIVVAAKQKLDAFEVTEAEEEPKPALKATKKQLEALVAAKESGGWTDAEVSALVKARYGAAKARDLDRNQALDLIRHLMSAASPAAQGDLGV